MPKRPEEAENLWLARALWELGGVRFGDFTIGRSTVHSPVYVQPRRLISRPRAFKRAARVMTKTVAAELARLRPGLHPFQLVAGVPLGGLHFATAFSLYSNIPLIYPNLGDAANGRHAIEGHFEPGQTVLIIDDLITTGGSVLESARILEQEGLLVKDALVLIDRGEGGAARLRRRGYTLTAILQLEAMLNYYLSTRRMDQGLHRKCCEYIRQKRKEYENA
ncbi:MAG TPA: phosphoribosyltransferase family protein [Dehalococcoidia bacterium]|nr:phosphoribosyltransferase family protein [Dehalococcoidia bacterium]